MIERRTITDHDEWLSWRRQNLGASEIAACFGLHPFKTIADVVADKRGLDAGPDPNSPLLRRGNALEDDAADEVAKLKSTWEINKNTSYFVDAELRLAATPDFVCVDPERDGFGVLQIKVIAPSVFKREWSEDASPFHVVLQVETEMMMSGASWGAIAPLVVGDYMFEVPHIYDVPRNADAEQRIVEAAKKFWAAFDAGDEPSIDYERDEKLIALLYPNATPGKIVDLTGDNRIKDLLSAREMLRWDLADLKKKLDAAETEIKAKMRDAEIAIVDGWRLNYRTISKRGYTVAPSTYRRLYAEREERDAEEV